MLMSSAFRCALVELPKANASTAGQLLLAHTCSWTTTYPIPLRPTLLPQPQVNMSGWVPVWVGVLAVFAGAGSWAATAKPGPNQTLIRSSVLLALTCMYLMWSIVYLAQLHPVISASAPHETLILNCPARSWHVCADGVWAELVLPASHCSAC